MFSKKLDVSYLIALKALKDRTGVNETRIIKTALHSLPEFREALRDTEPEREESETSNNIN